MFMIWHLVSSQHFAVKYFVISSNFLQKMFSVKVRVLVIVQLVFVIFFDQCRMLTLNFVSQLIHVDWPLSVMSLFDWVRFFSFSINVVRPECAFSWKFQTKVIVTLLTPISLSLLTLFCGFIYGMILCFKTWNQLEKERRESGKYVKFSYFSTLSCWYDSFSRFAFHVNVMMTGLTSFYFGM